MLIFTLLLAFYLAWNLGANDVANSMGTSVGSKAITLKQALIIAGILEFAGSVLFGQTVSATLATNIIDPTLFANSPDRLLAGMVVVLIACGAWMNIATLKGLPVSSSHAIVGAIAGVAAVTIGPKAIDWSSIGRISITWVITPLVSGAIAAGLSTFLHRQILNRSTEDDQIHQLNEWIPWLSIFVITTFSFIVLPTVLRSPGFSTLPLPTHTVGMGLAALAIAGLTHWIWQTLHRFNPAITQPIQSPIQATFAKFQLLSACFVAFAHGSNDVGNAIAPLAIILPILQTHTVPPAFPVPIWMLAIGGLGIVGGLAVWGKQVITTVGENILPLQPSAGFCAELATALTVLMASRWGFPVSTSHALVGGVIGVGLIQDCRQVQWTTVRSIALTWGVTIPIAAGLSAGLMALFQVLH